MDARQGHDALPGPHLGDTPLLLRAVVNHPVQEGVLALDPFLLVLEVLSGDVANYLARDAHLPADPPAGRDERRDKQVHPGRKHTQGEGGLE